MLQERKVTLTDTMVTVDGGLITISCDHDEAKVYDSLFLPGKFKLVPKRTSNTKFSGSPTYMVPLGCSYMKVWAFIRRL